MQKGKLKTTSKVGGLCSWDSSIHDSSCLNRITASSERAYLIVKVTTTTTSITTTWTTTTSTTTITTIKTWSSSTGGGQVEPPSNYGSGPEEENMLHSCQKALAGWETEKEVGTGNSFQTALIPILESLSIFDYPDLRKVCETCLCFQVASVRAVSVRYEIVSNVPKVVHISKAL